jgi:hypothetical protein
MQGDLEFDPEQTSSIPEFPTYETTTPPTTDVGGL